MAELPRRISVELDVPAVMRDGTTLRANVYRPDGEGSWPVLLTRLPYGKDLPIAGSVLDPVQAARRGYVVVVQDTRGRFRSEGEWEPMEHEAEDGFDTIAWAAGLPGASGRVGTFGASYFGFTQWAAAVLQPPALGAMLPFNTWADAFDGMLTRGGALELGAMAVWHLGLGFDVLARRHAGDPRALGAALAGLVRELDILGTEGYRSLPLRDFAPLRRAPVGPAFFDGVAHAHDRAFLDPVDIAGKQGRVQVPTYHVGGWYDLFLGDTLRNYRAMRALGRPTKLLVGPWTHVRQSNPIGELDFGFAAQTALIDLRADFSSLQIRWFDHWLKGIDTGIMDEPPVKLFVMGVNRWRDEADWPLADARETPLYLRERGSLSREAPGDEQPDRFVYDPADPVPTHGGSLLMTPEYLPGPLDQRPIERRTDVLVFATEPLARDTEVTGPVRVELWAASSAPDTDFVARLVDVFPDGRSINLADGIVRARHRDGVPGAQAAPLEPDRPYCFVIHLWATSNVFQAGHRIGLDVTSSCFPRWDRNPNTGHALGIDAELRSARQTIFHDAAHPSRVLLPIVERG